MINIKSILLLHVGRNIKAERIANSDNNTLNIYSKYDVCDCNKAADYLTLPVLNFNGFYDSELKESRSLRQTKEPSPSCSRVTKALSLYFIN